eukprot:2876056-Amphidinium_carterae.1
MILVMGGSSDNSESRLGRWLFAQLELRLHGCLSDENAQALGSICPEQARHTRLSRNDSHQDLKSPVLSLLAACTRERRPPKALFPLPLRCGPY